MNGPRLFRRYEGNPILRPEEWPYAANAVFNPGATTFQGETLLLARVEDYQGFSHLTCARSPDGRTSWRIGPRPTLTPDPVRFPEEEWGLEDPRITYLEGEKRYAVVYVAFSPAGPMVSLALTEDFCEFERLGGVLPPEDKDAALFPCKFAGRYAMIHRPIVRGEGHIWISFSPDLRHFGDHQVLLPARGGGWWDSAKVGLGAQPIETSEGWLVLYHGVRATAAGALYRVGLALLDGDDPRRVLHRSPEWVFGPHAPYEWMGDVPGVTFPTGAILAGKELRIYYGAADTSVALATADLDDLLSYLRECPDR